MVRTTFNLSDDHRASIQKAINETFSADIHLRFDTAPDLISGIELSVNGEKVAWSIAEYLASLEKALDELLKSKAAPENKTETKPGPVPETKAA